MGMLGHAAFIKDDGSVFAHVHPSGSIAMPALMLANPGQEHMMHPMGDIPPEADFPYGFPKPGRYHVIVQMNTAVASKPESSPPKSSTDHFHIRASNENGSALPLGMILRLMMTNKS